VCVSCVSYSMQVGLQKAITVLDYFEGPSAPLVVSHDRIRPSFLLPASWHSVMPCCAVLCRMLCGGPCVEVPMNCVLM
jgi:hypothetical protein